MSIELSDELNAAFGNAAKFHELVDSHWPEIDRALRGASETTMRWERADGATIDVDAAYLVKTNGEWKGDDFFLWQGCTAKHCLEADYVRGRPVWLVKIVDPPATE